ncbi:hypothetical protein JHN63_39290 [Streptomyces sp. MBT65]|uniref:hypothetical protein n=1 Tax=Streptomyces sp. MBT65 TaxID=1488395 RepID=UPI00190D1DCA|nr:hypothetical protein [Streptomyces sp. MBT65]MBK3579736.1 hypothetical protein [Streptomyces sp. MBT65]
MARADREYGHGQTVCAGESLDFGALAQHRLVEADRSAPAVGARVSAGELLDVGVGDRSGGRAQGGECELSQEFAFAAGQEHLGDAGGGKNADVPGAALGDVGQRFDAETRFWHRSWGVVAERYLDVRLRGDGFV